MSGLVRNQRGRRGESTFGEGKLILEFPQQRTVTTPRPCRVILGIDVSSSMTNLINAVIGGIEDIDSVLNDGDLVSVR